MPRVHLMIPGQITGVYSSNKTSSMDVAHTHIYMRHRCSSWADLQLSSRSNRFEDPTTVPKCASPDSPSSVYSSASTAEVGANELPPPTPVRIRRTPSASLAGTRRNARQSRHAEDAFCNDTFSGTEFLMLEIEGRIFLERYADSDDACVSDHARGLERLGMRAHRCSPRRSRSPRSPNDSPPRQCGKSHCDSHALAASSWYCTCCRFRSSADTAQISEDRRW